MSTVTNPPEMQEFWSPHETLGRPLHGFQPQTTIPSVSKDSMDCPHVPNRGGYGLSTDNLQPQIPELRASYGTSAPLLRELQPHLSFPTVFINIYIYY